MTQVQTNRWVRGDIDIDSLIKILKIDRLGIPYVKNLLEKPTNQIPNLLSRRKLLNEIHVDYIKSIGTSCFADESTKRLNVHTHKLFWFLEEHSDETKEYYDSLYYTMQMIGSYLNSSSTILHVSTISKIYLAPSLTLLGPVLSSLIPIIAMKWFGLKISYFEALKVVWTGLTSQIRMVFNTIMQGIMHGSNPLIMLGVVVYLLCYLWSIWTTIQTSLEKYYILVEIRVRLNHLRDFLADMQSILSDPRNRYFTDQNILSSVVELQEELNSNSAGKELCIFKKLMRTRENKTNDPCINEINKLEAIIEYARVISGNLSLARILRVPGYSLPNWYSNERPILDIKGLTHPSLDPLLAVPNDIYLDRSLLITGPNQAGKSTFMRSVLLATWMAQTIGIVRASYFAGTPFDLIYSYIGLTDEIGRESLFQAEMNAVYEYLNDIRGGRKKGICFFDELFTSTNHEEGVSAALAVGSYLERIPNSLTIISSHFAELAKLKDFKNVHLVIDDKDPNTPLKFTYKLRSGLSKDRVALRLMKEKGYNPELVLKAYQNLEELFPNSKCESTLNKPMNVPNISNISNLPNIPEIPNILRIATQEIGIKETKHKGEEMERDAHVTMVSNSKIIPPHSSLTNTITPRFSDIHDGVNNHNTIGRVDKAARIETESTSNITNNSSEWSPMLEKELVRDSDHESFPDLYQ